MLYFLHTNQHTSYGLRACRVAGGVALVAAVVTAVSCPQPQSPQQTARSSCCVLQVLHYLETLSPLALFSQLLAAAVCEALALLAASRGAALPAAAAAVDRCGHNATHPRACSALRTQLPVTVCTRTTMPGQLRPLLRSWFAC